MSKKRFFTSHSKSSAAVISLGIHAILIVVAISFVAVSVINKPDQVFEQVKVHRPKVPLKKLTVPINIKKKKAPKPKLRKRIVAKPTTKSIDIKMPEMTGIKGGMGYLNDGDGLGSLGFGLDIDSLFGGKKSMGNEFAGSFYDLKQTSRGKPAEMNDGKYDEVVRRFLSSWNENILERYFKAPESRYTIAFSMPVMAADAAPKAFGVGDVVKPKHWLAHYTGQFAAPETGRYRFCGLGDDILYVRVKRRLVLDASWPTIQGHLSGWESDDEKSGRAPLNNSRMFIGDWMELTKGVPIDMEVLIGERPGGQFSCALLIEQEGKPYKQVSYAAGVAPAWDNGSYNHRTPYPAGTRPILPIFKLVDIPDNLVDKMKLNPQQATLEGPTFGSK